MTNKTYQILFQDSPEYFTHHNARMISMDGLLMFRTFTEDGELEDCYYYPMVNVHRIKEIR